ncbi:MAG: tetratricopeptide repeat protein [Planctomycetota bacterium]
MLKNSTLATLFAIIILLSGILSFSGCQEYEVKTADTGTLVEEYPEDTTAAAPSEDAREQAVSMYVDAMMLNDLNAREQAIRKLNLAIELDPKFSLAYSLKGDILQEMEKYEDSANAYEQATVHDPWSFKDFFNLGKVCQIIEQWARAAKAYVSACKLAPQHYPAHLGAAQCYYELKEYGHSLSYAEKAKTLDPTQPDPELLLGDLFEAKKDHVKAINAYRRALELEGNSPTIMISLARAYLRSGRYDSAKELLADAILMDPDNSMAYQYMGFAQLKLKENAEAIKSYQQAVEKDENDWMARKGLGVAYMLTALKGEMSREKRERYQALALEQWNISLQIKPDQSKLSQLIKRYSD